MKECDILAGGEGVETYSDPSYIFSVGQDPQIGHDLQRPCVIVIKLA